MKMKNDLTIDMTSSMTNIILTTRWVWDGPEYADKKGESFNWKTIFAVTVKSLMMSIIHKAKWVWDGPEDADKKSGSSNW